MKGQSHNKGELKELSVKVEKDVVEAFERMATVTKMPLEELVVIALKRYRASHSDFEQKTLKLD